MEAQEAVALVAQVEQALDGDGSFCHGSSPPGRSPRPRRRRRWLPDSVSSPGHPGRRRHRRRRLASSSPPAAVALPYGTPLRRPWRKQRRGRGLGASSSSSPSPWSSSSSPGGAGAALAVGARRPAPRRRGRATRRIVGTPRSAIGRVATVRVAAAGVGRLDGHRRLVGATVRRAPASVTRPARDQVVISPCAVTRACPIASAMVWSVAVLRSSAAHVSVRGLRSWFLLSRIPGPGAGDTAAMVRQGEIAERETACDRRAATRLGPRREVGTGWGTGPSSTARPRYPVSLPNRWRPTAGVRPEMGGHRACPRRLVPWGNARTLWCWRHAAS